MELTKPDTPASITERSTKIEAEDGGTISVSSVTNSKASFDAILNGVDSTQRDWPGDALRAILSKWRQMPKEVGRD